jgi:hypothetical protein
VSKTQTRLRGRFLLSLSLTLMAGLLIVSAAGKLSDSWLSPWVIAPETRHALLLAIFCGILSLFIFCKGYSRLYGVLAILWYIRVLVSKEMENTLLLVLNTYNTSIEESGDKYIRARCFGLIMLDILAVVVYLVFRLISVGDLGGYRDGTGKPLVLSPDLHITLSSFFITPVHHFLFPFNQSIPSVRLARPAFGES